MTGFDSLGLSGNALSAVKRMGFNRPTPVQEKAIPLIAQGRDIIAAAQTGTGKTAAFSLPAMDNLGHASGGSGPLMLVITPTRELAQQIGEVTAQIALSTHHRITTVVGGLSYKPQIEKLKRGTDVLIATPGRLIDLMDQKAVRLADVEVLVLDEADRMLDMGFLPSVKKIVAATPASRQTLLFSATIDKSIMGVVGTMLHDPATVEIARKGDVAQTVDQFIIRIPQSVKPALIKAVLAEKGAERVIVFARTRSRADSTCKRLRKAGYAAEAIHSDRSQNQRRRALDKFARGEVNIITATDVLARGIDVDQVDYVVNYDAPEQAEDYIHRIGRTGRAGKRGFAITFVTPETEGELRAIEKLVKTSIPELELEDFDLSAAEAEAAAKSISAQSRRDPEVNRAKREMANRAQKKAEKAVERKTAKQEGKDARRRKRPATPAPKEALSKEHASKQDRQERSQKRQRPTRKADAKRNQQRKQHSGAQSQSRKSAVQKQKNAAKGDFRPGRSRRAEVQRSRSGKRR